MRKRTPIAILLAGATTFCAAPNPLQRAPLIGLNGGSISLEPIDHNGHKDLAREVRSALGSAMALAPRHAVEWLESDGAMRVQVEIVALNRNRYTETVNGLCRRVVPPRPGEACAPGEDCPPTEVEEPCEKQEEVEDVSGRFLVQLTDGDGVRFRYQYHLSVGGTSFPLKAMALRLTEQIERLVVPWMQNPRSDKAAFSKACQPRSSRCKQAYRAFAASRFAEAEALLTAELGAYADISVTIPAAEYPAVAKALCNRGLVREYQQAYPQALADYRRAAVVAPNPKCAILLERLKNYSEARQAYGARRPTP